MTLTDAASTQFQPDPRLVVDDLAAFTREPAPVGRVIVEHEADTPTWLPYVLGRLQELLVLSYEPEEETPSPHPDAIRRALLELIRFMKRNTPTPSVIPTFEGGVQFVWHKAGWDIEIEVGPEETTVWAQPRDGSASWCGSLDEHIESLRVLVDDLTKPA